MPSGEWKRAKLHNLEQQLAFAKLVRINAMHDEIMEIADDPDLLKPDTKQVKHRRDDGSEYETTEVALTPREKRELPTCSAMVLANANLAAWSA